MTTSLHAVCSLACAPMRLEPSHKSEMTNQLLFGERCRVLQRQENFWEVEAEFDGYRGWIVGDQLAECQEAGVGETVLVDELLATVVSERRTLHLPLGAVLQVDLAGGHIMNGERFQYEGAVRGTEKPVNAARLLEYGRRYLETPYQWGGRTPWGIDCSGLTQMVFRAFGVALLRDSTQQITQGMAVESFADLMPGDLAFFIGVGHHVGIVCGEGEILHSSGRVRIDKLDAKGIWNSTTGENTHRITALRRII